MGLAPYPWFQKPAELLESFTKKLPSSILIHGPRGSGTYELGEAFAKLILCSSPVDGHACGQCAECKLIEAGNHPDFKLLLSEAEEAIHPLPWQKEAKPVTGKKTISRTISIEQIRALSDFIGISSHRGGRRVVLVYPADTMMADQSSALLKTLEEPPPSMVFILVSDNLDRMLPTIRSRCQLVRVAPPTQEQGVQFLKEKGVENPVEELAKLGGMPLLYFEQDQKLRLDPEKEEKLLDLLAKGPALDARSIIDLSSAEYSLVPLTTLLQRWCNDLVLVSQGLQPRYFLRRANQTKSIASSVNLKKLYAFWDELNTTRRHLQIALNPRMMTQDMLFKYKDIFPKRR